MNKIHIDQLEIRLRGISPQIAHSSVSGLGEQLHIQLKELIGSLDKIHTVNTQEIDAGTSQTMQSARPSDLREMITAGVVNAIASEIKFGKWKEA